MNIIFGIFKQPEPALNVSGSNVTLNIGANRSLSIKDIINAIDIARGIIGDINKKYTVRMNANNELGAMLRYRDLMSDQLRDAMLINYTDDTYVSTLTPHALTLVSNYMDENINHGATIPRSVIDMSEIIRLKQIEKNAITPVKKQKALRQQPA